MSCSFAILALFSFLIFLYAKDLFDVILTFVKFVGPLSLILYYLPILSIFITILRNNEGKFLHENRIQVHGVSNKNN